MLRLALARVGVAIVELCVIPGSTGIGIGMGWVRVGGWVGWGGGEGKQTPYKGINKVGFFTKVEGFPVSQKIFVFGGHL